MITARIDVRQRVYERDNGACGICGEPMEFDRMHLDHVMPLSAGGPDTEENVQVAHPSCNFRKNGTYEGVHPTQRRSLNSPDDIRHLLRVPRDIWEDVRVWASEDRRSLNQQVIVILQRAVEDWRKGR